MKFTAVVDVPTANLAYLGGNELKFLLFPCPSPKAFLNSDIWCVVDAKLPKIFFATSFS